MLLAATHGPSKDNSTMDEDISDTLSNLTTHPLVSSPLKLLALALVQPVNYSTHVNIIHSSSNFIIFIFVGYPSTSASPTIFTWTCEG